MNITRLQAMKSEVATVCNRWLCPVSTGFRRSMVISWAAVGLWIRVTRKDVLMQVLQHIRNSIRFYQVCICSRFRIDS